MSFKFCPECGFKFDREYKFCPECGYKIGEAEGTPEPLFDFSDDTAEYDDAAFSGFDAMLRGKAGTEEEKKSALEKLLSAFEYETHTNGTISIISLKDGNVLDVVVPEGVTSILSEAFMGKGIISVALPEGLMQIGDRAFKGCKNLMTINFPASLMVVGDEAFADCESLETKLPSTVKKVGKNAMGKTSAPEAKKEVPPTAGEEGALETAIADYKAGKYDSAIPVLQHLAEEGNAMAQYYIGCAYNYGCGVGQNKKLHFAWSLKAAEQGLVEAQYEVGFCYRWAMGVSRNEKKAVYWYQKAANQGHPSAMYGLGCCYQIGVGVPVDTKQAIYWHEQAVAHGERLSIAELKKLKK